jgi:hypothetical protein
MRKFVLLFAALVVSSFASSQLTPAFAQATRTWVSGAGSDSNDCSRATPCQTFAGAIAKTNAGGEINCLDSGGFGGVIIGKAISIICDHVEAGVLVSGTNGITVNGGPNDVVYLSGLDIEGTGTGINGIAFNSGAALHVRNSIIRGFATGIVHALHASAELYVTDTYVSENLGLGIFIVPSGAAVATVSITRTNSSNNLVGFKTDLTVSTGSVNMIIKDSVASGNTNAGVVMFNPSGGTGKADVMLYQVVSAINGPNGGLRVDGSNLNLRIGNSTISGNGTGIVTLNGGVVSSYLTNQIDGNVSNGPTPPPIPLK